MDIRSKNQTTPQISSQTADSKLTDSLIFNLIKKLQMRMEMERKYEETRSSQVKRLSSNFGRHIHSTLALGYLGLSMSTIIYFRFRGKMKLSFQALIPQFVIAITINQFERYRNITNVDHQMLNEYKSYQSNLENIILEKRRRISLIDQIKQSNFVTYSKVQDMLKHRPLY